MTDQPNTPTVQTDDADDADRPHHQYYIRGVSALTRARLRALSDVHERSLAVLLDDAVELMEALLPTSTSATYERSLRARLLVPRGGTVAVGDLPELTAEQRAKLGLYQPFQETRLGEVSGLGRLFRPTLVLDLVVSTSMPGDVWVVRPHGDGALVFSADDALSLRKTVAQSGVVGTDAAVFVRLRQFGGTGPIAPEQLASLEVWRQWAERIIRRPIGLDRRAPAVLDETAWGLIVRGIAQVHATGSEGEIRHELVPIFWPDRAQVRPPDAAADESGGAP